MNNLKKLLTLIAVGSFNFVNAQYYRGTGDVIDLVALSKAPQKIQISERSFANLPASFLWKNLCPHQVTKDNMEPV